MELLNTNGKTHETHRPAVYVPLVKCDQATMRRLWPKVRLGCQIVKARDNRGDVAAWDVTHVRRQLDMAFAGQGTAELWQIVNQHGEYEGFVITLVTNCPYKLTPQSLVSWITYTEPNHPVLWFGWRKGVRRARAILKQLEDYARELGLEYHDGYTTNIKWVKWLMLVDPSYRIAQFMFRKNLH